MRKGRKRVAVVEEVTETEETPKEVKKAKPMVKFSKPMATLVTYDKQMKLSGKSDGMQTIITALVLNAADVKSSFTWEKEGTKKTANVDPYQRADIIFGGLPKVLPESTHVIATIKDIYKVIPDLRNEFQDAIYKNRSKKASTDAATATAPDPKVEKDTESKDKFPCRLFYVIDEDTFYMVSERFYKVGETRCVDIGECIEPVVPFQSISIEITTSEKISPGTIVNLNDLKLTAFNIKATTKKLASIGSKFGAVSVTRDFDHIKPGTVIGYDQLFHFLSMSRLLLTYLPHPFSPTGISRYFRPDGDKFKPSHDIFVGFGPGFNCSVSGLVDNYELEYVLDAEPSTILEEECSKKDERKVLKDANNRFCAFGKKVAGEDDNEKFPGLFLRIHCRQTSPQGNPEYVLLRFTAYPEIVSRSIGIVTKPIWITLCSAYLPAMDMILGLRVDRERTEKLQENVMSNPPIFDSRTSTTRGAFAISCAARFITINIRSLLEYAIPISPELAVVLDERSKEWYTTLFQPANSQYMGKFWETYGFICRNEIYQNALLPKIKADPNVQNYVFIPFKDMEDAFDLLNELARMGPKEGSAVIVALWKKLIDGSVFDTNYPDDFESVFEPVKTEVGKTLARKELLYYYYYLADGKTKLKIVTLPIVFAVDKTKIIINNDDYVPDLGASLELLATRPEDSVIPEPIIIPAPVVVPTNGETVVPPTETDELTEEDDEVSDEAPPPSQITEDYI